MKEFEKVIEVVKGWGYEEYDESFGGALIFRKPQIELRGYDEVYVAPNGYVELSHCGYGKGCFSVTDAEYESFEDFFRGEGLTTYLD